MKCKVCKRRKVYSTFGKDKYCKDCWILFLTKLIDEQATEINRLKTEVMQLLDEKVLKN